MATLDVISLGTNGVWTNEFEGSKVENTQKWTTKGRLFNFQKKKIKHKKIVFDCTWLTYVIVQQLEALRDSGAVVVFTHNDNRVFNVILDTIESTPLQTFNEYAATDKFEVVLTMIEV